MISIDLDITRVGIYLYIKAGGASTVEEISSMIMQKRQRYPHNIYAPEDLQQTHAESMIATLFSVSP